MLPTTDDDERTTVPTTTTTTKGGTGKSLTLPVREWWALCDALATYHLVYDERRLRDLVTAEVRLRTLDDDDLLAVSLPGSNPLSSVLGLLIALLGDQVTGVGVTEVAP